VRDKTLNQYFENCKKSFFVIFHNWFQSIKEAEDKPSKTTFNKLDNELSNQQANFSKDEKNFIGIYKKRISTLIFPLLKQIQAEKYASKPSFKYKLSKDKMAEMILTAVKANE